LGAEINEINPILNFQSKVTPVLPIKEKEIIKIKENQNLENSS
jgi:hypothetical protein